MHTEITEQKYIFQIGILCKLRFQCDVINTDLQNGCINRLSVESDARLKKIVLTDKAVAVHKAVLSNINKREQRLRQDLTDEEIDTFLKIADRLIKNMEEKDD